MHPAEKPAETVHPSTVHCVQGEEPGQGWVSLQKDPRTGLHRSLGASWECPLLSWAEEG